MNAKSSKRTRRNGGGMVELKPRESPRAGSGPQGKVPSLRVFKLKHILVPVDFSDCSRKSLEYAVPFARQFGAAITLLFVIQPYLPVSDMAPLDVEAIELRLRETGEKELAALRRTIGSDIKTKATISIGSPHVEIVRAARDLEVDLIILSTHGRTGLTHVLMGSTTERVVRHAGCPVLVLREEEHEFVINPRRKS